MLEELCSATLWNACCAIRDGTPMVRLRGSKAMVQSDWNDFFRDADINLRYSQLPKLTGRGSIGRMRVDNPERSAWPWITEHSEQIIDGYIRARYSNDLRRGMQAAGTYNAMHDDYLSFFRERRRRFLEDEKKLAEIGKAKLVKQGFKPTSPGSVAALLRVLTRTMKEAGASVLSIAKMQYAVCTQAGIILPSEFLTDVLVADQIMKEGSEKT